MKQYINAWRNSPELVLQQECHFLAKKEVWMPEDGPIPPIHNHIFTEIEFVSKGSCVQKVNGHTIECTEGSVVLLLSRDVHEYVSFSEETHLYCLCFADDVVPKELRELLYTKNTAISVLLDEDARLKVINCFQQLLKEKKEPQLYGKLLTQGVITEIIVHILRCTQVCEHKISNSLLEKALKYVQDNFKQSVSLNDVAQHVHITPQYFSKLFKTEVNITFHTYLRNMRLDHAMTLLNTTSMSVTEVCMESGFNSVSNFTKIFKERFNVLPKEVKSRS